jgi:hypothetical protein
MTTMSTIEAERVLRNTRDPLAGSNDKSFVKVREVQRVFEPDADGTREVLYLDDAGLPHTAYLYPDRSVSIAVGW